MSAPWGSLARMSARTRLLALCGLAVGLALGVALTLAPPADASRNSSGTYALPAGNPVVPGTPISSTWANNTLADLSSEMTDSLSRSGKGAMLAPLQLQNGNAAAPGLTFGSDTNTGFYRVASDVAAVTAGGVQAQAWTPTGTTIPGTLGVTGALSSGNLSVTGTLGVSGAATLSGGASVTGGASATGSIVVDSDSTNGGTPVNVLVLGGGGESIGSQRTAGVNTSGIDFYTASIARMSITNAGGVQIPGAYVANPGTPVTGIYGATYNIDFLNVNENVCDLSVQVLAGVATTGVCVVSSNLGGAENTAQWPECFVSGANQVTIRYCSSIPGFVNPPARDYRVRVFQ